LICVARGLKTTALAHAVNKTVDDRKDFMMITSKEHNKRILLEVGRHWKREEKSRRIAQRRKLVD
jgi:hypothetical protein